MERLRRIWAWIKENAKLVLAGVVAFLLALAGIFGLYWWRERKERQRQEALQAVRETGGRAAEAEDMANAASGVATEHAKRGDAVAAEIRRLDEETRKKREEKRSDDLEKIHKDFKDAGL